MAEKEERILCIETEEKIVECGYGDFYETIPKTDAIEKMAKAIYEVTLKRNQDYILHAGILAEAALNALLEGK